MAWSTEVSIFTFNVADVYSPDLTSNLHGSHLRLLSAEDNHAVHTQPRFSPDGTKVAYLAMRRAQYESDRLEIVVVDLATHSHYHVTADLDLSFNSITWDTNFSVDSSASNTYAIIATAQHHAVNKIFRILLSSNSESGGIHFSGLAVLPGCESRTSPMLVDTRGQPHVRSLQGLYFLESSLTTPNMLKMADDDVFGEILPADLHAGYAAGPLPLETQFARSIREIYCPCPEYYNGDITMPRVTQYYFPSRMEDGSENTDDLCHMFYLPPVQLQSDDMEASAAPASVPLVVIVHGGPQSAFTNSWNYRWNLSFYASKG